ncbi:MAG: LysM peptidoglycan-binding domain-containing protein [Bacteroidales bacterium]|nr:LysM peptidoglycan-binding domain-containing protein [Bacteroidota bacterium]NLN99427.1 LysM peptidoglycan-binding domain-containing protein [Bacteroidales bacterium]
MMKTNLTAIVATACLLFAGAPMTAAQEYIAPEVVVSKDKIRSGGKVYYSHVVQEKQTLFSISKAYGVSLQEIFDANKSLNLETEGLKKNQILLIPVKEGSEEEVVTSSEPAERLSMVVQTPQRDAYFFHRVRWYEDLNFIARKYEVSPESIMNINGLATPKVKTRQMLKIPRHPEMWENLEKPVSETEEETPVEIQDTTEKSALDLPDLFDNIFQREGKHDVQVSLLLPINARAKVNDLAIDLYSGALLAARDLGNEGTNLDLSVFDVGDGTIPVTRERFSRSDFVIGPVSNADLIRAVNICQGTSWIVSPLDPKTEALADTIPNLIQAPTPTNTQILNAVRWIGSDLKRGDKVILITQKGVNTTDYAEAVSREMSASGIDFVTASYSILEGRNSMQSISNLMTTSGTNRIITASDSEAFLIEVVRNLYLLAHNSYDIVLYSTSRIRTFDTIDIEQLHSVNLHVSVSYFIDYNAPAVQKFIMDYRALFNAEPNQFAFQGYDLMKGLTVLRSRYGRNWDRAFNRMKVQGLQSDLEFVKTDRGGYVNKAVRRIVYARDYSINLVK